MLPADLQAALTHACGRLPACTPLAGGSIANTVRIDCESGPYALKYDTLAAAAAFAAEADGLAALAACHAIRVPRIIDAGRTQVHTWLLLEFIDCHPLANDRSGRSAGAALAELHRHIGPCHGWPQDNFLGSTPQINTPHEDWATFFANCRLGPQIDLAERHANPAAQDSLIARGRRLLEHIPSILGHRPEPSLLHGDLWHGNVARDAQGRLTLIDPVVHYGDRECDLAMSRLFGGFPPAFYAGYIEAWPLPEGHARREPIYRLYHVLNHVNLFGSAYRPEAEQLIAKLLAASG